MKNLVFFLLLLSFSSYAASFSVTLDSNHSSDRIGNVSEVPCTISVSISGPGSVTIPGVGIYYSSTTVFLGSSDSWIVGSSFPVEFRGSSGESCTITVNVVSGIDPENPDDPDDPDPDPDPDPDSNAPWALEVTLQGTNRILGDILHNSGITFDALSGLNQPLNSIRDNQLANNSLLNDISSSGQSINNSLSSGFTNVVDWLRETLRWQVESSTGVASGNTKLDSIHSGITGLGSGISDLGSGIGDLRSIGNVSNQNLSHIDGELRDLKDTLNPSGLTSLSPSSPVDSLPSQSGFISGVKNKLLPGFSFFSPSGDEWLTFNFTIPLSSFGMSDFTFVFGGSDWTTVAGGSLLTVMSITRTLSKFAFYLMFLMAVIKSLRQW